jgi:hypothetical protein
MIIGLSVSILLWLKLIHILPWFEIPLGSVVGGIAIAVAIFVILKLIDIFIRYCFIENKINKKISVESNNKVTFEEKFSEEYEPWSKLHKFIPGADGKRQIYFAPKDYIRNGESVILIPEKIPFLLIEHNNVKFSKNDTQNAFNNNVKNGLLTFLLFNDDKSSKTVQISQDELDKMQKSKIDADKMFFYELKNPNDGVDEGELTKKDLLPTHIIVDKGDLNNARYLNPRYFILDRGPDITDELKNNPSLKQAEVKTISQQTSTTQLTSWERLKTAAKQSFTSSSTA